LCGNVIDRHSIAGRLLALIAAVTLLAVFTHSPGRAPGAPSVADLERDLDAIRAELGDVGADYDRAYWRLDETETRIEKLDARIAKTEKELQASQEALGRRLQGMYRMDAIDYLTIILGASSFQELVTTLDFIKRVGDADAAAISESKRLAAELQQQRAEAEREREEQAAAFKQLAAEREKLRARLSSVRSRYDSLKKELDRQRGTTARQVPGVPAKNGMVFPVQGVHYYSDTWGASRDGGRRSHKGTDIMAPRGTSCVAVLSGSVSATYSGKGGKSIYLHADNGWVFYYAHLDGYAISSGTVQAGQVIGYVGSTGNASASAPHLHFEIHPGGGGAVNPYPYLRAME